MHICVCMWCIYLQKYVIYIYIHSIYMYISYVIYKVQIYAFFTYRIIPRWLAHTNTNKHWHACVCVAFKFYSKQLICVPGEKDAKGSRAVTNFEFWPPRCGTPKDYRRARLSMWLLIVWWPNLREQKSQRYIWSLKGTSWNSRENMAKIEFLMKWAPWPRFDCEP